MPANFSELPERLVRGAYKWADEFAWPRNDAMEVIKWAKVNGSEVDRVEVWLPSPDGPIIPARFVYAWSLTRAQRHAGAARDALEYIEGFEWDLDDEGFFNSEPYFNLALDGD